MTVYAKEKNSKISPQLLFLKVNKFFSYWTKNKVNGTSIKNK